MPDPAEQDSRNSRTASDLRRVVTSGAVYAVSAAAQRGLAFFLLPIYTRFIDPVEYGTLEVLTALTTLVFSCLLMGLPSAIQKCFHRDCKSVDQRARLLSTAILIELPVLVIGVAGLYLLAPRVAALAVGQESAAPFVRLLAATALCTSISSLILAGLRAQERAIAFSVVTLVQFTIAVVLNILLVVRFGMGIHGVLWGNLISNIFALPIAIAMVRQSALGFDKRSVKPLLKFGFLLVPVMLSGWIVNLSDRYVLGLFAPLGEVGVYGVGYKFGRIIELLVVWPFQLAWPAVSFSISRSDDHRQTFSKTLTYLVVVLAYFTLALSILTRIAFLFVVGEEYRDGARVVPLVALAYAFMGVQYCVVPGIHIAEKTKYVTFTALAVATLNLILNFILIPRWGMMGAAWATVVSLAAGAFAVGFFAQRFYTVPHEHTRLAKAIVLGLSIYFVAVLYPPSLTVASITWHIFFAGLAFPVALLAASFFDDRELSAIKGLIHRG